MGKPASQGAFPISAIGRGLNAPAGTGTAEFRHAIADPDEVKYQGGAAEYNWRVKVSGRLGKEGKAVRRANCNH